MTEYSQTPTNSRWKCPYMVSDINPSPSLFTGRSLCSSRHWRRWPEATLYLAAQLRERLGAGLPPSEHQTHSLLGGGPPAPCPAASGWGVAHYATDWPRACELRTLSSLESLNVHTPDTHGCFFVSSSKGFLQQVSQKPSTTNHACSNHSCFLKRTYTL